MYVDVLILTSIRNQFYFIFLDSKYEDATDVKPIAATIAFIVLVMVVCIAAMVFEFINTYSVRKSILLGPASMYLLTLATC